MDIVFQFGSCFEHQIFQNEVFQAEGCTCELSTNETTHNKLTFPRRKTDLSLYFPAKLRLIFYGMQSHAFASQYVDAVDYREE